MNVQSRGLQMELYQHILSLVAPDKSDGMQQINIDGVCFFMFCLDGSLAFGGMKLSSSEDQ